MIHPEVIGDLRQMDDLVDFTRTYPARVGAVAQSTFQERQPDFLARLRQYPQRRAVHPFIWSTDPQRNARARRRFFAMVNDGDIQVDGYGSVRTNALAQGYSVELVFTDGEVIIFVRNKASRAYRYTKGNRQVPGHAATGWEKDAPIIEAWVGDYTGYLLDEVRRVKTATTGGYAVA